MDHGEPGALLADWARHSPHPVAWPLASGLATLAWIRCAIDLRERLRHIGVEVRAGLPPARCRSPGPSATWWPGPDLVLEDRGAYTLRGMAGQWQLFAVRS